MAMERGSHLIPSRTQKLSPSSPMVLHARVWKSRSLPDIFFRLDSLTVIEAFFLFIGFANEQKACRYILLLAENGTLDGAKVPFSAKKSIDASRRLGCKLCAVFV